MYLLLYLFTFTAIHSFTAYFLDYRETLFLHICPQWNFYVFMQNLNYYCVLFPHDC